ncbi:toxin Cry1Ac domain D-VI-related protein [Listeria sp. ILCC797]|uniref:toxin Cry1Ac domain D-VI-related protein n=1 Tax=Listeria sp. ILCC797 TaxID=1918333 RepID=UPI000B587D75|nr:toxin Cry1Ac domain D-VI-related protein [Listeria sp. ILCC797]
MNKKKWIIGIGIGAVLLVGGGYGLTQYQTHAKAEEEQQAFETKQDQLAERVNSYKKQAAAFYLTAKKERLAEEVTTEQVAALESQLNQLKGKEMRVAIAEKLNTAIVDTAYASKMVDLREQVNDLLDQNGALAEKANVAAVEKQATELKEAKPVFYAEQNKIIQRAKQQQAQIKKANQAVDNLFTDTSRKTIKSNVTRTQFQAALTEKNKVKQAKAKQALIQDLNRVESHLTAQEKQAAEQKAQEKASEPQAKGSSNTAKGSSSPSATQGRGSSTPSSNYTAPSSPNQGSTSSSKKSTAGNSSSSSRQPSSSKKPSSNGGSSSNSGGGSLTPGDSWDIDLDQGGSITGGENGNTWQGGTSK